MFRSEFIYYKYRLDPFSPFLRSQGPRKVYQIVELDKGDRAVHFFGDQVAFDKEAWLAG